MQMTGDLTSRDFLEIEEGKKTRVTCNRSCLLERVSGLNISQLIG